MSESSGQDAPGWRWTYRLERDRADEQVPNGEARTHARNEDALLDAVTTFVNELRADAFEVRMPFLYGYRPDDEPLPADSALARVFGQRLDGFVDGATVGRAQALLLVREMFLGTCWFRLEAAGRLCITVDWDAVLVDAAQECDQAVASATAAGLVVSRAPWSPRGGLSPGWVAEHLRPVDDAFWAEVADILATVGPVMLHESGAWETWYRLTPDRPRVELRPRSRVSVEPDLPLLDLEDVLADLPDEEGIGFLIWVDRDGRAHERAVEGDDLPDLHALLADATRAGWMPFFAEDTPEPYLVGGVADADGVVRFPYTAWAVPPEGD